MNHSSFKAQRIAMAIRAKATNQREVCEWTEAVFGVQLSCSDGGCVFGHPGGMHTNFGCQHLKIDRVTTVLRLRYLAAALGIDLTGVEDPNVS
jgi:hypothetical protein